MAQDDGGIQFPIVQSKKLATIVFQKKLNFLGGEMHFLKKVEYTQTSIL